MSIISGMLHAQQNKYILSGKCLVKKQAGKCTWETLTTDMFSEVTINNHKCHVSGFKEQMASLVVFTCERLVH